MNGAWLQQVGHLLRNGRTQEAISTVEEAAAKNPEDPYVLLGQANVAYYGRNDYPEAMRLSDAAIGHARAAGDKLAEANALNAQARALRMLNRYEESLGAGSGAVEAARAAGDKLAEANALETQAGALRMLERYDESLGVGTGAVEAARAAGDKLAEANALDTQARALLMLDRYEESLAVATGAVEPARAAGDKLAEANALNTQARALLMLDRYEESLGVGTGAVGAARAAGDKLGEASALNTQAGALRMLNRYEESLGVATGAVEAARAGGDKLAEANALNTQARALQMLDRYEDSLAAGTGAMEAARAAGSKLAETNALVNQVLSLSELGRSTDRERVLERLASLDPSLAERMATVPARPGWYPLVRRIVKEKSQREANLKRVLSLTPEPLPLPPGYTGKFLVLRKWASYTTVDLMREETETVDAGAGISGGGYFLWWDGWGLVIDPGLGFCKAFRAAGLVPQHISALVATHHHIDHTGDMLPILTCVYEMNREGEPAHRVDFALSPGAFAAFADVVAYAPGVRSVQLLRR